MDLRQVEYVIAVVDNGGFTRAAEATHVTQPALSQAIKALERELGTPLFHRLGRHIKLTPAGEALVGPGRQMLRDATVAREAVAAVVGLTAGSLDLVALPTLAVEPLVALIGGFRRSHPDVTIRVQEPESLDEAIAAVREGACELGLIDVSNDGWPPGLDGDRLGQQELLAICNPELLPRRISRRVPIADIAHLPIVTTPPGTSTRRMVDEAYAAAGHTPVIAVETGHREALLPLAAQGAVLTFLPEEMAKPAQDVGAVALRLNPPLRRTIGLVRRRGPLSPAAAVFRLDAIS